MADSTGKSKRVGQAIDFRDISLSKGVFYLAGDVACSKLPRDSGPVMLDGASAYLEKFGGFRAGFPLGDERENFALAFREPFEIDFAFLAAPQGRRAFDLLIRKPRRKVFGATADRFDGR